MSRSNAKSTHSGFAQFLDHAARDRFVQSTLDRDPHLKRRAFLSESRPTIIFESLTSSQRDQIQSALAGLGQWFDDVQFDSMS